ncbi:MAG: iron-containing alcohol dehydrogenase [Rickettsiales bacterium]|nr:iron-containing alcohol dehydrogenase [Rickettsiales bacterium]
MSKSLPNTSKNMVFCTAQQAIADLDFSGKKIVFVTDEKIWKNCQKFFPKDFLKIVAKNLLLKNPKADEKNLKKIANVAKGCDLILALGSGVINDLCKFTSAEKNIPYAIFASAASMNGYLSKNASITVEGHKKTLPATLPIAVFCDLKILKSAPLVLTKAGIGDSLCFYSCWFDWYLSHKILGTKFDEKPFEILRKKMEFFVKNFQKFSIRDEEFLKILIEILMLSGQGMTMAGGSYPASQSEHLIVHAIEMKYPKLAEKNLHGAQIAVTTLTAARLQESLLNLPTLRHPELVLGSLTKFFGKKIAQQCQKEYDQKLELIKKSKTPNWIELKKHLKKIHLSDTRLREIFAHFKIKTSAKSLGLSNEEYQACVAYAKFIRNRFTCLDFFN